jgi:hypothetical protein
MKNKKSLKKFGSIPVSDSNLECTIEITNIRYYRLYWEADVKIHGKVSLRLNRELSFRDSSIQRLKGVSKIKLNRILRKFVHKHVDMRLRYFGGKIDYYDRIKKITWV